jgi:eukaryotic-like serine/threonine-protein kinase
VRAYYAAINAHDYAKAWQLGGDTTGQSFTAFVDGFSTTANDRLTILSVSGNIVTVQLNALQTDGTVRIYQGTYTVGNGTVVHAHVQRIS